MAILSIQSQVVYGRVGNSVAGFALQRIGFEVWQLPTTLLSHHPGHGGSQGEAMPPALLNRLLDGLVNKGCFHQCVAVLSGYLGHADNAALVMRANALAHGSQPPAVYLCDPVLGDDGRLYVDGEIVAAMHNLAAKADILTPNAFELAVLSGDTFNTREGALQAMRRLQGKGPKIVVLSSFIGSDTPAGTLEILAIDRDAAWRLVVPDLGRKFHGAGDLFAALFLGFWIPRRNTRIALNAACSAVQAVLAYTASLWPDALPAIEPDALRAIKPDALHAIKPDAFHAIKPDALRAIEPDALRAMRSDELQILQAQHRLSRPGRDFHAEQIA